MKRILSLALSLCLVLSLIPTTARADGFSDMPASTHWSYEALTSAVENGLLNGSNGKLMPGSALTRAQMAAIINRAFGAIDTGDISKFTDVSTTDWYYADIAKAVRMGTFQGDGSKMNPDAAITREQAFTVLARAFHLEAGQLEDLADFSDAAQISSYAVGPMAALVNAGYVNGSDGKLQPKATITREQFAQVIYKMLAHYISDAGTYTDDLNGNVMVNAPGVILQDMTITGDLIIGEGVGNGEVTLDGVELLGRLVVRGGGENSIVIKNESSVGNVILSKTGDGGVRLYTEEGCRVEVVYIPDGKDDIILEGTFNQVSVDTDAPIVLKSATVTGLTVTGENANIETQGNTDITAVVIEESAAGATLNVDGSSTVTNLVSAAEEVTIEGKGTVVQATISGDNTEVNTEGTSITTTEDVEGVTAGGEAVDPGTTTNPNAPSTPSTPSTPNIPDIPDEPSKPDKPNKPDKPDKPTDPNEPEEPENPIDPDNAEVNTLDELKAALKVANTIIIKSLIAVENDALVVNKDQTLIIEGGLILTGKKASLTNYGTVINQTVQFEMVEVEPGTGWYHLIDGQYIYTQNHDGNYDRYRKSTTINDILALNEFSVNAGASLINYGTLTNWIEMYIYDAVFENHGTFENKGSPENNNFAWIHLQGTFTNTGTVNNDGEIRVQNYVAANHTYLNNDNGRLLYGRSDKDASPIPTLGGTFNNNTSLLVLNASIEITGTVNNTNNMTILHTELTVSGTVQNKGRFHVDQSSEFVVSGIYTSMMSDDILSNTYVRQSNLVVEKDAIFNNYAYMSMQNAKLTNNGTFNNGALASNRSSNLYTEGTEIINNGTWANEQNLTLFVTTYVEEGEEVTEPSFKNYGTFVNDSIDNDKTYGYVNMEGGSFYNRGHIVNNRSMSFRYAGLTHEGNQIFENSGNINLFGGSFDVSKANAETFVNTGYFSITDEYGDEDVICEIDLGKREAFHNSSNWVSYAARVRSTEGWKRAEKAQVLKLKYADSYYGFDSVYNWLDIYGEVTISEDTTFSLFGSYDICGESFWNSDKQQSEMVFGKLTIEPGVTLTLDGVSLGSSWGGILNNEGTIKGSEEYYGSVYVWDYGSYTGDGSIECEFTVSFEEDMEQDDLHGGYASFTIAMNSDGSVYTVDQNTDLYSVYDIDDDTEIVVLGHCGELSGAALENAVYRGNVHSAAGLRAATYARYYGRQLFDIISIEDGSWIVLDRDLSIRQVMIAPQSNLEISHGVTLTVIDQLTNHGDLHVGGTLYIAENGYVHNGLNLEAGALTGNEIAQIIVAGRLYNKHRMTLYPTAELIKEGDGWFRNNGEMNDMSSRNDFANNP